MKVTKRQLRRIIREEKVRIVQGRKSKIVERKILNEALPALGVLVGGGLLIALSTKGGRSLLAKILRINGNMLDKFETIDNRVAKGSGKEWPLIDELSKIVTQLQPGRVAMDELADLLEGLTDDEGAALNQALEPVKAGTPAGRIAKASEALS